MFYSNRKTQLSDLVGLGSDGCCVRLCHGGASSAPKDRALEHVFCQAVCHLTKRCMESSNLKTGREQLKKQHLGSFGYFKDFLLYIIAFEIPRKA